MKNRRAIILFHLYICSIFNEQQGDLSPVKNRGNL